SLQLESSLQVLMRQEDVPLGEPVCPSQLGPYLLPVMWQLYPGRRYRGSDSSFWRIVYHIEASFGDTEDMLLEQMADPESCSSHLLPPPEPQACRGDVRARVHLRAPALCVLLCHTQVQERKDGQRMSPPTPDLPAGEVVCGYSFLLLPRRTRVSGFLSGPMGMGPTRLSLVSEPLDQLSPVVPAHTCPHLSQRPLPQQPRVKA
ncbi:hypothetical protein DBR06_SOUSAS7110003, partial [Sousa chinensis]